MSGYRAAGKFRVGINLSGSLPPNLGPQGLRRAPESQKSRTYPKGIPPIIRVNQVNKPARRLFRKEPLISAG